jgi:hypothetical protein
LIFLLKKREILKEVILSTTINMRILVYLKKSGNPTARACVALPRADKAALIIKSLFDVEHQS